MRSFDRIASSILASSSRAGTMIDTFGQTPGSERPAVTRSSDRRRVMTNDGVTASTQQPKTNPPANKMKSDPAGIFGVRRVRNKANQNRPPSGGLQPPEESFVSIPVSRPRRRIEKEERP